jgi:(S)-2-hydroxyglutarate dehydrogenase
MPTYSLPRKECDVLIVGAGILGVTVGYWLSVLFDSRIILVDMEDGVARHTSSRNTGVIHRPFYLDPVTRRVFARTAELSYPIWRDLARRFGLPWSQVGTLEVATTETQIPQLEKYARWGAENGIGEAELEVLDRASVKSLEPHVECKAALLSKTDASVDFGVLTHFVHAMAARNGLTFLGRNKAVSILDSGETLEVEVRNHESRSQIACKLLVNAAGGGALRIAHALGLAKQFSTLSFRGEYWYVEETLASKVTRNVYTPPRYQEYPFLDPHFVVRSDGRRQVGPNAALVSGPYVYQGLGFASLGKFFEAPNGPKANLLRNRTFLSMVANEWRTSLSKRAMCSRVREFIPDVNPSMLKERGVSGIRSSLIDETGFVPEARLIHGVRSLHVLNYNSPGATGAPAFSAMLVSELRDRGDLSMLRKKASKPVDNWDFENLVEGL